MKSKQVVASFVPLFSWKLVSLCRLGQTGRRVAVPRRGLRAGSATLALAIVVMFGIVSQQTLRVVSDRREARQEKQHEN
jgi:uncharacterized DUF497 family protein